MTDLGSDCHASFPFPHAQVLKFSSSGETWVERAPYHSPDLTVPVKSVERVKKEDAPPAAVTEEVGVADDKPYIPPPPPLPPIMAPTPEEEEEEEKEGEDKEKERDGVSEGEIN